MVTIKQFGGRPIECMVDKELNGEVVNNYCWIHSTFSSWKIFDNFNESDSVETGDDNDDKSNSNKFIFMLENDRFKLYNSKQINEDNMNPLSRYSDRFWHSHGPYPGVDTITDDSFLRYHKYVQWVAGILVIQVSHIYNFFHFTTMKLPWENLEKHRQPSSPPLFLKLNL